MSASSRARARITHKLWGKASALGGPQVTIRRDPLHLRFEANRYGIRMMGAAETVERLRQELVDSLRREGWREKQSGWFCHQTTPAGILIDGACTNHPNGKVIFFDASVF